MLNVQSAGCDGYEKETISFSLFSISQQEKKKTEKNFREHFHVIF